MSARVELGFFSFTEVTDPAGHHAYNEWHQLDHLPQQYELAGVVHGQRWVSTPGCTAARAFQSDELAPIHYVTTYLMSEPVAETLQGFSDLAVELRNADRFFEQRRSRLSGPFAFVDAYVAERVLVSADVVPFRPGRGVYVIVERFSDSDALAQALETTPLSEQSAALSEHPGVAGVWRFATLYGFEHLRWRPGHRRITVCYLDEAPVECAQSLGKWLKEVFEGPPEPEFAGPFESITAWRWDWFDDRSRRH